MNVKGLTLLLCTVPMFECIGLLLCYYDIKKLKVLCAHDISINGKNASLILNYCSVKNHFDISPNEFLLSGMFIYSNNTLNLFFL